jgi:hypothetical protein
MLVFIEFCAMARRLLMDSVEIRLPRLRSEHKDFQINAQEF